MVSYGKEVPLEKVKRALKITPKLYKRIGKSDLPKASTRKLHPFASPDGQLSTRTVRNFVCLVRPTDGRLSSLSN